jgi:hypothetical protein
MAGKRKERLDASTPSRPARQPSVEPSKRRTRIIGKALRKVDAVAKVTGATKFADDLALPRMLYCKLLRSALPIMRVRPLGGSTLG